MIANPGRACCHRARTPLPGSAMPCDVVAVVLRLGVAILSSLTLAGCAVPARSPEPPQDLKSPFTGYRSARYDDPRWWLCMPGRQDACSGNLDATDLLPDGTNIEVQDTVAPGADQVDCFYVYPTVDLRPWPASHENFADLGVISTTTVMQAARFRNVCRLYVPLYRQTTIGAYLAGNAVRAAYRDVAVSDVVDAFLQYMGQYNRGHKIVLLGHSQGGEMVVALLQRLFDHDPLMRERLLLAMPIGWPMEVPPGKTTGGTFDTIPVCTEQGQTGCVVGYRSYDAHAPAKPGHAMPTKGMESVCVEPSRLAHGTSTMSRSFFGVPGWYGLPGAVFGLQNTGTVKTPFVMAREVYEGKCVDGANGFRYLAVDIEDGRSSPVDLDRWWLHGELGYHILDMQFEAGDLVDLVAERVKATASSR
jgi:pimeloyl-ACP methyl ester carboxylesterase